MSKEKQSLLLYFETCAVDSGGLVVAARMNEEDFKFAEEWNANGFVKFGRVYSKDVERFGKIKGRFAPSYWVELSQTAWGEVERMRRERAERMAKNRKWKKAEEK